MSDPKKSQSAAQLLAQGETQQAIAQLTAQPHDEASQVQLRELYIGENDVEKAMPLLQTMASTDSAEGLVSASILALIQQDLTAAVSLAEQALQRQGDLATAYNHLGRALQNSGQSGKAIKSFKTAIRLDPYYAQAWHNLGHTRRALGVMDEAVSHYQKAIECQGGYQSAWYNWAITQSVMEQHEGALKTFDQLLKINPQHTLAWVNQGLAWHVLGQLEKAIECYDRAMDLDPDLAMVYSYKGVLLNEMQQSEQAIRCLQHALSLDPNEIDAWCELCDVYEKTNQLAAAEQANAKALALDPQHPTALIDAARIDKRNKQFAAALAKLEQIQVAALPVRKATEYWFERGAIADHSGDYEAAWQAYRQANELARQSPRFQAVDATAFEQRLAGIRQQIATLQPPPKATLWQRLRGQGTNQTTAVDDPELGSDLCFLVGFPRSGTTLIDTILSVHSQVHSIEEMPTIETVIKAIGQAGGQHRDPQWLASADWSHWRQLYWQQLKQHATVSPGQLVLDKLPLRFLEVAFIQQLFPAARFVFMLRHPGDVVISNFMQNYVPNQAFVHFSRIEEAVDMYAQCMEVWQQLAPHLGQQLMTVKYEALVSQPQTVVDKLCQFLRIPFQAEMLDTDRRLATRARVSTNSYAQVAEDINQGSVSRWRNYQAQLAPYQDQLQALIKAFGY
ncbi:tetratricopeptide repeat-containing sulfotransferase family protein [Marinicella meishanensis]|uniref:tetratricopeptide repeat-containing sulfotransferase family protein n=1 Tax=Marinicella meishanensis TaxID=2873263 RepID=UPI001CC0A124|nr:tetratricopeptide repeat-containing sulfotransferase family protein [Marinicella sp. NBU2979]